METIDVSIQINAPLERVFNALSDHESYGKLTGVHSATLRKHGNTEKNGKGAIRQLNGPGISFIEEITAFERNKYFEYKVLRCYMDLGFQKIDIPLHHEMAELIFKEKDGGTEVNWISVVEFNLPIFASEVTQIFSFMGEQGFLSMLRQFKEELEK